MLLIVELIHLIVNRRKRSNFGQFAMKIRATD
jgi:hypothetical protein